MKGKIILIIFMSAAVVTGFLSCSGNSKESAEQSRQDSIARQDSIMAAETAAKEAAKEARLDSIRNDSIEKVTNFVNTIPNFSRLYNASDYSFLKKLGFTKSVKGKDPRSISDYEAACNACLKTTWTLKADGSHYCVIVTEEYFEGNYTTFTIVGASEKLQQAVSDAKREQRRLGNDENCSVSIKGNTISWGCGA